MARHPTEDTGTVGPPALVRWGAVLAGTIIGFALMLILASLWIALAYGTGTAAIEANLNWYLAVSLIVSMFVGGFLAGWLAGIPRAAPGFFNGLTVFGLVLVVLMTISLPAVQVFGFDPTLITPDEATGQLMAQGQALWTPFLSLLIGVLAAGLGGALGGGTTRPAVLYIDGPAAQHTHTENDLLRVPPHEHRDGQTIDLREEEHAR